MSASLVPESNVHGKYSSGEGDFVCGVLRSHLHRMYVWLIICRVHAFGYGVGST